MKNKTYVEKGTGLVRKKYEKNNNDIKARNAVKNTPEFLEYIGIEGLEDWDVGEHEFEIDLKATDKDIYVEVAIREQWLSGDRPPWPCMNTMQRKLKEFKKFPDNSFMVHIREDAKRCAIAPASIILEEGKIIRRYLRNSGGIETLVAVPMDKWYFMDLKDPADY